MIRQGLRGQCRLTHSQGDTKIAKPNTAGFNRPSTSGQASAIQGTTTAYQQPNNPSQPCEGGKTTRKRSQAKGETQLKSNHTAELFLALTWPKQLSHNTQKMIASTATKTRAIQQPKLTMSDGNQSQSQNQGEPIPSIAMGDSNATHSRKTAHHEYTVVQNENGLHSQQKRGEDNRPKRKQ